MRMLSLPGWFGGWQIFYAVIMGAKHVNSLSAPASGRREETPGPKRGAGALRLSSPLAA